MADVSGFFFFVPSGLPTFCVLDFTAIALALN
jgi:hypothetical protein